MTVLLTRPSVLSEYLAQQNIAHQTLKMFDYKRKVSLVFLKQILTHDNYDLVILSSPAAIDIYLECNVVNKVACISPFSAKKIPHLNPLYLQDKPFDGNNLANYIVKNLPDKHSKILILAGSDGQVNMFDKLSAYYDNIKKLEIYERTRPEYDRESLESVFYNNVFETVVVTCNEAVKNLLYYIDKYYLRFNRNCNLIVPSKRVATFASNNSFKNVTIAESIDDNDLLEKILAVKNA
jgi:uroporphyrinogen-III synthase